jgi:hypothetical protein
MVEDHLKSWLVSRLTLAERLNIQRRDEEAEHYPLAPGASLGRCIRCDAWLSDPSKHDRRGRCLQPLYRPGRPRIPKVY